MRALRGAAIFAASFEACLFPSLDDLGGEAGSDASVDVGVDVVPPDSSGSDVVVPPSDAGEAGCSSSDPNLVGWWKLDEGSGFVAHDCSGNGRDGTFVYGTAANWVAGHNDSGAAIRVDPATSSGCISVGSFPAITGVISIAFWTNVTTFPVDGGNKQYFMSKAYTFSQGGFRFAAATPPDEYDFGIDLLGDAGSYEINATALATGTWLHLGVVYVPGVDITVYVNGAISAHKLNAPAAIADDTKAAFRIGCRGDNADYASAILDDVRVYDRALSANEMAALAAK